MLGMVVQAYSFNSMDAEVVGWRVQSQPGLHTETLSSKNQKYINGSNNETSMIEAGHRLGPVVRVHLWSGCQGPMGTNKCPWELDANLRPGKAAFLILVSRVTS